MLWLSHNSHFMDFGIIIHSCLGMRMLCRLHLKARSQQNSFFFSFTDGLVSVFHSNYHRALNVCPVYMHLCIRHVYEHM